MLDSRYGDLKNGRVKPITRDEVIAHFRERAPPLPDATYFMIAYDFHPEARLVAAVRAQVPNAQSYGALGNIPSCAFPCCWFSLRKGRKAR